MYDREEARDFKMERDIYHLLASEGGHQNFLEFYHAGTHPQTHLVLSMFHGKDLFRAHIHPDQPFASLYRIANIADQLLLAGAFLAELDVLHGDLKPANILINPEGEIKVMDFGNSSRLEERLCDYSLCSIDYASPEAVLGIPHGTDADLWSIVVIVYKLVTKKTLFSIEQSHRMRANDLHTQLAECRSAIQETNETIDAAKELGVCLDRERRRELLQKKERYEENRVLFIDRLREEEHKEKELIRQLENMQDYRDQESRKAYVCLHRFFIGKEAPDAYQDRPAYPRSELLRPDWEQLKPDLTENMLIDYPDLGKNEFSEDIDKRIIRILGEVFSGAIRWQDERVEIGELKSSIGRKLAELWSECDRKGFLEYVIVD